MPLSFTIELALRIVIEGRHPDLGELGAIRRSWKVVQGVLYRRYQQYAYIFIEQKRKGFPPGDLPP